MKDHPWLTFDCYDTLVRYTESKSAALVNLGRLKKSTAQTVDIVQAAFKASEKNLQLGPFMPLNKVLRQSLHSAMATVGMETTVSDEIAIIDAVKSAPPFPDVIPALQVLKKHHRLAILSNSEPDIIRHNVAAIGIDFDAVVLATEAKCYKPALGMFQELLERTGEPAGNVTHIAQSIYHDIRPARDCGFGRCIWINRFNRSGDGDYKPDAALPDLSTVCEILAN